MLQLRDNLPPDGFSYPVAPKPLKIVTKAFVTFPEYVCAKKYVLKKISTCAPVAGYFTKYGNVPMMLAPLVSVKFLLKVNFFANTLARVSKQVIFSTSNASTRVSVNRQW